MQKTLSIAIAAYNVASTLGQTLDSLEKASCLDQLDVMVIDDGSTDETAKLADEYAARHPTAIRVLRKQNGGWGSTVNTGMQNAEGKYFLQLDGDDYLTHLDELVTYLDQCQTDLVYMPYIVFRDQSDSVMKTVTELNVPCYQEPQPISKLAKIPSVHAIVVRTEILRQAKISVAEHCFYTDVEFVLKICSAVQSISFFALPVYCYRLGFDGQSMSKTGVRKHYHDHVRMLTNMFQYKKALACDAHIKAIFDRRLSDACYYQYLFFFALPCTKQQQQELKAFDAFLKATDPAIYEQASGKPICILRRTHFHGYWLVAHLKDTLDQLTKKHIYQCDSRRK
ncbi:MAG: glycosyltransferase family 2 protein [Clostridia bacterium]